MICIREFTEAGVEEFDRYIENIRENPGTEKPELNSTPYSVEFQPAVEVDENIKFSKKLDLAGYVNETLKSSGIFRENILENRNLWTWLAYLWFDRLCEKKEGKLVPRERAKYICSSGYQDYYRHLIAGPYSIYSLYGEEYSLLFLYNKPHQHSDFIEQIASRQKLISRKNFIVVLHKLYLNRRNNTPKRGVQSREQPGNLRRFIKVMDQFELTYNIYNMDPDKILNLLPDEFNNWKSVR